MKNAEITFHLEGLNELIRAKNTDGLTISGNQKLQLIKLIRELESAFVDYQKTRELIVLQYAKKDGKGQVIKSKQGIPIEETNTEQYKKEISELDGADVVIDIVKSPVRIPDANNLTPQAICVLSLMSDDVDRMFAVPQSEA